MTPRTLTAGAAAAGGYLALQHLGRTYGATAEERRRRFPGDEIAADFIMSRQMLRGVKARAEGTTDADLAARRAQAGGAASQPARLDAAV